MVEDPHDGGVVAGGFGDGERLVGERLAAFERAAVRELRAQRGEHERPVGMVGRRGGRGPVSRTSTLSVSIDADAAGPAPVVGQGGGDEPVGVAEVGRPARGVEERLAKRRVAGLALRGAEPDREVEPEDRVGVVGLGVEVERLRVVAQRVGRGERGERGVAGLARVADGLGEVDGLGRVEPVAGQLADPRPGPVAAEVLRAPRRPAGAPGPGGSGRGPRTGCAG